MKINRVKPRSTLVESSFSRNAHKQQFVKEFFKEMHKCYVRIWIDNLQQLINWNSTLKCSLQIIAVKFEKLAVWTTSAKCTIHTTLFVVVLNECRFIFLLLKDMFNLFFSVWWGFVVQHEVICDQLKENQL